MIALLEGKESVTVSEALELRHIQYPGYRQTQSGGPHRSHRVENQGIRVVISPSAGAGSVASWGISSWICWGAREGMDARSRTGVAAGGGRLLRQPPARTGAERNDHKKQVFKYCTEQASAGEEIEIKELSAELLRVMGTSIFTASSVRSTSWRSASRRTVPVPCGALTRLWAPVAA